MADAPARARLTVLAGPSGVGKGSVVSALRALAPDVWVSVSWATRARRPAEVDGVHYVFVDEERFAAEVARGGFLESAEYAGHRKGTPRAPVEERLAAGVPVLLEIDVQGARLVRAAMPDALLVFLAPPSMAELARRLVGRGTDDAAGVQERLAIARAEMAAADEFDAVIVNDDVEQAAARLLALMRG
ncbi:MAG TPA: guanylate kinase [Mycobacteriales bacterium]